MYMPCGAVSNRWWGKNVALPALAKENMLGCLLGWLDLFMYTACNISTYCTYEVPTDRRWNSPHT